MILYSLFWFVLQRVWRWFYTSNFSFNHNSHPFASYVSPDTTHCGFVRTIYYTRSINQLFVSFVSFCIQCLNCVYYDKWMLVTYLPDTIVLLRKIESVWCRGFGFAWRNLRKVLAVARIATAHPNPTVVFSNEFDTFINSGTCTLHKEHCKGSIVITGVFINAFLEEIIACYLP